MRLSECKIKKSENLHFMRFIASLMVIFSHSYELSGGLVGQDIISRCTQTEFSIGTVCVTMFFLCSGYLISKSVERAQGFFSYMAARLKRLIPPLAFVVVLTVLFCSFITTLSPLEYFTSTKTLKYLLNSIMIINHELPGVFANNHYATAVNGSLWTIPVEFACYIACYIFFKLGLLNKKRFWYTIPLMVAVLLFQNYLPHMLNSAVRPCVFFYLGMLYYVYREHIVLNIKLIPLAVVMLVASFYFQTMVNVAMLTFWPYILFAIWFAIPQCPKWLGNTGEISYGVYLWGFVIQQVIIYMFGGMMPQMLNFVCASIVSIIMGIITFLICEKPFLKNKM